MQATSKITSPAAYSGHANVQLTMATIFKNPPLVAHFCLTADPINDGDETYMVHIKQQDGQRTTTTLLVGGVLLGMGRCEPNATHGATPQVGKTTANTTHEQIEA